MNTSLFSVFLVLSLALNSSSAADSFQIRERTEVLPEVGTLRCSVLSLDAWEFSFLRPNGWAVQTDAETKKITFCASDYSATLIMQVRPDNPALRSRNASAELKRQVIDKHPAAKIDETFPCYTGNLQGQAFDLQEKVGNNVSAHYRVAFVAFEGGSIEFTLITSATSLTKSRQSFDAFVSSVHVNRTKNTASTVK